MQQPQRNQPVLKKRLTVDGYCQRNDGILVTRLHRVQRAIEALCDGTGQEFAVKGCSRVAAHVAEYT